MLHSWSNHRSAVALASTHPWLCSMTSGAIQQGVPPNVLRDIMRLPQEPPRCAGGSMNGTVSSRWGWPGLCAAVSGCVSPASQVAGAQPQPTSPNQTSQSTRLPSPSPPAWPPRQSQPAAPGHCCPAGCCPPATVAGQQGRQKGGVKNKVGECAVQQDVARLQRWASGLHRVWLQAQAKVTSTATRAASTDGNRLGGRGQSPGLPSQHPRAAGAPLPAPPPAHLDVSVDDALAVQVLQRLEHVLHDGGDDRLLQALQRKARGQPMRERDGKSDNGACL